ncbi:cyclophilin-like fold protein [Kribbella sp. NPDC023855]|uniref:cyclophilin-like fold protein n=1 Tax=Kribbella sp. NPDC023855 TaxID=3154698 RepID=UPI0033E2092A
MIRTASALLPGNARRQRRRTRPDRPAATHHPDPEVGDIGYYAPGNDLVLYYGNQSYYDGIVVVGRLQGDAAQRIADLDGSVEVQVQRA